MTDREKLIKIINSVESTTHGVTDKVGLGMAGEIADALIKAGFLNWEDIQNRISKTIDKEMELLKKAYLKTDFETIRIEKETIKEFSKKLENQIKKKTDYLHNYVFYNEVMGVVYKLVAEYGAEI